MAKAHGRVVLSLGMIAVIGVLSSGCATRRAVSPERAQGQETTPPVDTTEAADPSEPNEVSTLAALQIETNPHVEKWIRYFTVKDRDRFHRFLKRGNQYKQAVADILDETGVPAELYYLAMIESGYHTRATSHASATGVWQFIHATGKRYGLQSDRYVDERRDPIRSTEAAAKYLRDLYNVFGSWPLALAAYNSGEFRIMNAIIRGKSRDFWALRAKGILPSETADYVPKFFAAALIGRDPAKYGFTDLEAEKYPDVEAIEVPSPIRLRDIASAAGVPLAELERVNPHIHRGVTPASLSRYEIWVPAMHSNAVSSALPKLASRQIRPGSARISASASQKSTYVVKPGDSLFAIAREHSTSVAYLKRINGLSGNRLFAGTRLRLSTKSYRAHRPSFHRVARGDNLNSIARRYGLALQHLKELNGIRGDQIWIGQRLRLASN